MAKYLYTHFFRLGGQGWTESYNFDADGFDDAVLKSDPLDAASRGIRTNSCLMEAVRIVQLPPDPHITRLIGINKPGMRTSGGVGTESMDVASTAAMMRGVYSDGSARVHMLRGLLDLDVVRETGTGLSIPAPGLVSGLKVLASRMASLGVQKVKYDRLKLPFAVSEIVPHATIAGHFLAIVPAMGGAIPAGKDVFFRAAPRKKLPWIKGFWLVLNATTTSLEFAAAVPLSGAVATPGMYVREYAPLYRVFRKWSFGEFRSRQTGRPTQGSRGKSSGIHWRR